MPGASQPLEDLGMFLPKGTERKSKELNMSYEEKACLCICRVLRGKMEGTAVEMGWKQIKQSLIAMTECGLYYKSNGALLEG